MEAHFVIEAYLGLALLLCAMGIGVNTVGRMLGHFWASLSIEEEDQGKLIAPYFVYMAAAFSAVLAPFIVALMTLYVGNPSDAAPQTFGMTAEAAMWVMTGAGMGAAFLGALTMAWFRKGVKSVPSHEVALVSVSSAFVGIGILWMLIILILALFGGSKHVIQADFLIGAELAFLGTVFTAIYGAVFRTWMTKQFSKSVETFDGLEARVSRRAMGFVALAAVPALAGIGVIAF